MHVYLSTMMTLAKLLLALILALLLLFKNSFSHAKHKERETPWRCHTPETSCWPSALQETPHPPAFLRTYDSRTEEMPLEKGKERRDAAGPLTER